VTVTIKRQTRHLGDIRIAIAAALQRPDETAVDLADMTVKFAMFDSEGSEKVAATTTGVSVTDEDNGYVQYSPVAADVDTEGVFYGYFIVIDGDGKEDTFPAEKGGFEIVIEADY